jgi:hypothetical protein
MSVKKHHIAHIIKLIFITKTQRGFLSKGKHQIAFLVFANYSALFLSLVSLIKTVKMLATNYKAKTEVHFKTVFDTVHTIQHTCKYAAFHLLEKESFTISV